MLTLFLTEPGKIAFGSAGQFDKDFYSSDKFEGYDRSLAVDEEEEEKEVQPKANGEKDRKGDEEKKVKEEPKKRKRRWDDKDDESEEKKDKDRSSSSGPAQKSSRWDDATPTKKVRKNRWDETPVGDSGGATPVASRGWDDATPKGKSASSDETPRKRSRWDETPTNVGPGMTPIAAYNALGATPVGNFMNVQTPIASHLMTPEQLHTMRWEKEVDERNRPMTDEELDEIFPKEGYKVVDPPASYQPIRTPARKVMWTPTPAHSDLGFIMTEEDPSTQTFAYVLLLSLFSNTKRTNFFFSCSVEQPQDPNLPAIKPEDKQYFGDLLEEVDEEELTLEQQKDRKIMKLLLKIKNGTPPMRKQALRQITDKARDFGPGPLFNQILPLLMSPTLEDQERHLLVKVIDRILYKLDDLVRPYVHKVCISFCVR